MSDPRISTNHPTSPSRGNPQRILVVDDDDDIRRFNAETLADSGYQVATARDGAEAWEALQQARYDLLLTDNHMPRMTGLELLHKLHSQCIAMPVIMATGTVPTEELDRCPWLQIGATLLKPYKLDALLGTVREVLRLDGPGVASAGPSASGPLPGPLKT